MAGYNERLFSSGFRAKLHFARFLWAERAIKKCDFEKIDAVELGCFDGRLVEYLPKEKLHSYSGYDADWEGGLSAIKANNNNKKLHFHECTTPEEFQLPDRFNLFVALETLEHISDNEILRGYLTLVAEKIDKNGIVLISVPNEIGLLFLVKFLYKKIMHGYKHTFTNKEIFWETMGMTSKVERDEHKGFNYNELGKILDDYFDVYRVEGIPFKYIPPIFNFNVGFVCKTKSGT